MPGLSLWAEFLLPGPTQITCNRRREVADNIWSSYSDPALVVLYLVSIKKSGKQGTRPTGQSGHEGKFSAPDLGSARYRGFGVRCGSSKHLMHSSGNITLHRLSIHDVRLNTRPHPAGHAPIPHGIGIDHDRRPCSHWSRHPDILARTLFLNPCKLISV